MSNSKEALNLFTACRHMVAAELYLAEIINSKAVTHSAKQAIKLMRHRLNINVSEIKGSVKSEADRQILEQDLFDPNISLQFNDINDKLAMMPIGIREQCEDYINGLYNVYNLKEKTNAYNINNC